MQPKLIPSVKLCFSGGKNQIERLPPSPSQVLFSVYEKGVNKHILRLKKKKNYNYNCRDILQHI